jgi:hypothetical protein
MEDFQTPIVDGTGRPVTRTRGTTAAYRARYPRLYRAAGGGPQDHAAVISWFVCQHERWAPATISQYRAALRRLRPSLESIAKALPRQVA